MKYPDSFHTTLLYIGNNYSKLNTTIYKNFKEDVPVAINISSFVVVPTKLVGGVVKLEEPIETENKCAHMTTFIEEWPAVATNNVMESLFTDGGPYERMYSMGFFYANDNLFVTRLEIPIKGMNSTERVYIIKREKYLELNGLTKAIYAPSVKHS